MAQPEDFWGEVAQAADKVAEERDADVLLYNGDIASQWDPDEYLIDVCNTKTRRSSIMLILVTYGGNPHVAYRIARCLQQRYEYFTVYIPGICMSAGTLVALGANEIVMADHGRLGPLDVQVYKPDELYESGSGLDTMEAVDSLRNKTLSMFRAALLDLKVVSRGQITLKTAMETASSLTAGIFAPVYQQIDPTRLGEITRSMSIAEEYGTRLNSVSGNLQEDMLEQLVAGYPSHSFVIDRKETEALFRTVKRPTEAEERLAHALTTFAREPYETDTTEQYPRPIVKFISTGIGKENHEGQEETGGTEGEGAEAGPSVGGPGEGIGVEATPNGKRKSRKPRA